jgi:hypothetical protein
MPWVSNEPIGVAKLVRLKAYRQETVARSLVAASNINTATKWALLYRKVEAAMLLVKRV